MTERAEWPNLPREVLEECRAERPVWNTTQLQRDFEVLGFYAPYVAVRRREDGQVGTLKFTHRPRWYFGWKGEAE